MNKKYIWLFGEGNGQTANNNSYYLWKYIVDNHSDDVDAYFIAEKTVLVKNTYRELSLKEKKYFIWRNSAKHIYLYKTADLLFVSLSYKDVQPQNIGAKSYKPEPTAPLVYLQHGTTAIKRLNYSNNYANNSMIRFVIYNPNIKKKLQELNGFKEYQIFEGKFHPRYAALAKKSIQTKKEPYKKILWFITWREYFKGESESILFLKNIQRVLNNNKLVEYLQKTGNVITLCLHSFFDHEYVEKIRKSCSNVKHLRIVYSGEADIMDLLASHDVMITDYSSVGFDFTFLGKPVILYQPDLKAYLTRRELYCELEELRSVNIEKPRDLVESLINERYSLNTFFEKNSYKCDDIQAVASGVYLERFFNYFWSMEKNSIAFLGYDFSGIGGTVTATRALMEGLLEKGYLVRAYTLKQMYKFSVPAGVPVKPATRQYAKHLEDRLLQRLFFVKQHYGYLQYDPALEAMRPLAGFIMRRWMKTIHASTVISTRESLHLFLIDASSKFISNKIYYFHAPANLVNSLFPGVLSKIQEVGIEKACFVTEKNRKALLKDWGFGNYNRYMVTGNSLDSSRSLSNVELRTVLDQWDNRRNRFDNEKVNNSEMLLLRCITMLRISKERYSDLKHIIQFGKELQKHGIRDIKLDVYGKGECVDIFLEEIDANCIDEYIEYCGETENIKEVLENYDVLIDFSEIQSFGMMYIEGILNGKYVLCRHNEGSDEVLVDIPDAFYSSYGELIDKIHGVKSISSDQLYRNYTAIYNKYSRSVIVNRLIELITTNED